MSAQFILEYAGAPVRFNGGMELVDEANADKFIAEQDAWWAAYQNNLNPAHCRVVNLYVRNQAEVRHPKTQP